MRRTTRRGALAGAGTVSLAALLGACRADDEPATAPSASDPGFDGAATCRQTAEQAEGPFYFDVERVRSDIREDRDGVPLRLGIRVRDADGCVPVADAVVDLWHCDAAGGYSGFEGEEAATYLRGAQVTDAEGVAEFTTIFPGGYSGRTAHIHAKIHLDNRTVLTTQVYVPDDASAEVHGSPPYRAGGTANGQDGLYDPALELTLQRQGEGWRGLMTFDVVRA